MKQLNLKNLQNNLRKKFLKLGVKMAGPETIFFKRYKNWKKCNY